MRARVRAFTDEPGLDYVLVSQNTNPDYSAECTPIQNSTNSAESHARRGTVVGSTCSAAVHL